MIATYHIFIYVLRKLGTNQTIQKQITHTANSCLLIQTQYMGNH